MECHTEMLFRMLNSSFHSITHKIIPCSLFYHNLYAVPTAMSDFFSYCSL